MENIVIHGSKKRAKDISANGSLSLECALGVSLFAGVVFALICIIQYVFVYSVAKNAAINTAEKIAKDSCIFFKSGIAGLSENVKSKAINAIGDDDGGFTLIKGLAEKGFDALESGMWESVAYKIMESEIEKELGKCKSNFFSVKLENLLGSSFFLTGSDFTICASVESDLIVPWVFGGNKIKTTVRVSANAWLYGAFSGYDVSDINVWSLEPMKRGVVLNEVFGGNLPQMFPTIDIYDKKARRVTSIVSIDTTKKTYLVPSKLTAQIVSEATKLKHFNGGTCENVTVSASDFDTKKLLVVFPTNKQTEAQAQAVFDASMKCSNLGIIVDFVSYQESGN